MAGPDIEQAWIDWTHDASDHFDPEGIDSDELIDAMADHTTGYADEMLDEFKGRFGGGVKKTRGAKRRKPARESSSEED